MDSKLKKIKGCKVELSISLNLAELEEYKKLALAELWKNLTVKWFREWHIPDEAIEENVWKDKVKVETTNQAINKSLVKVAEEKKLYIISKPEVRITSENPLEFSSIFEIRPEINLWDYQNVKLKKEEVEVSEKEIDEQVEFFRWQVSENKKVEREAKKWDLVNVDFEWFDSKWKTVPNTKSSWFSMDIWSWKMIPWFEDEVLWMKEWEEKDFDITFPKEYHAKDMAGKKYKFHIKVNEVLEKKLSELNEELIEKITWAKKSIEDFKLEIKSHLKVKKESEEMRRLENELLQNWSGSINFDIPESETAREVEWIIDSIKLQWLQAWMPWENYQKKIWKTEEELKKEVWVNAGWNVKKRYIIQEIIRKEWITVEDNEIEAELSRHEIEALSRWQKFDKTKYEKGWKDYFTIVNQILIWKVFSKYLPASKCEDTACTHKH